MLREELIYWTMTSTVSGIDKTTQINFVKCIKTLLYGNVVVYHFTISVYTLYTRYSTELGSNPDIYLIKVPGDDRY